MTPEQLDAIQARYRVAIAYPGIVTLEESAGDVPALLAYARDLEAQRDAARSVCHEREEELMELQGSCRAPSCILHRAHRGPCHVVRAALTATEGQA